MAEGNGFPLDLPDINDPVSLEAWQRRVVDLLDFTADFETRTFDATATTLGSLALEQEKTYLIESWVLGSLGSADGATIVFPSQLTVFRGGFFLDASNVAQTVGSGVSKIYSAVSRGETAELWTTSLGVSGGNVVQTVTGGASDVIIWKCRMKLFAASL